jgi:hypothetical protein
MCCTLSECIDASPHVSLPCICTCTSMCVQLLCVLSCVAETSCEWRIGCQKQQSHEWSFSLHPTRRNVLIQEPLHVLDASKAKRVSTLLATLCAVTLWKSHDDLCAAWIKDVRAVGSVYAVREMCE